MVGILIRFLAATILVFATWNPSGYSYVHWGQQWLNAHDGTSASVLAFAGILLLIGWVLFLRATLTSLGPLGIALAAGFFGTLIWMLADQNLLSVDNQVINYLILLFLAFLLTVGMSWSHLWRRLSGQTEVDEV